MPRIEIVVSGLDGGDDGYPGEVAVGVELGDHLHVDKITDRLQDLSRALLILMTYSPQLVADAFGDE